MVSLPFCRVVRGPPAEMPAPTASVLEFQLGSLADAAAGGGAPVSRGITKESFEALPMVSFAAERHGALAQQPLEALIPLPT